MSFLFYHSATDWVVHCLVPFFASEPAIGCGGRTINFLSMGLIWIVSIGFCLILTKEGHTAFIGISWNGKVVWALLHPKVRRWEKCVIDLDYLWPFYGVTMLETVLHWPSMVRGFTTNFRKACIFIHKHAGKADIKPRAESFFVRLSEKGNAR